MSESMPFQMADEQRSTEPSIPTPMPALPTWLRKQRPALSDVFVVDERIPMVPFFRALAERGFSVINLSDGRLVITQHPEDFRA